MKIDEYLPRYDFFERHEITINASQEKVFETLQNIDFAESMPIRFLFWFRGLRQTKFQDLNKLFIILYDDPPKEIILGGVACPWRPKGGFIYPDKKEFKAFNESGFIKLAWNFYCEPTVNGTRVTTETRVSCLDKSSKAKFRVYWFFVRPFSGLVRIEMLKLLRHHSELD